MMQSGAPIARVQGLSKKFCKDLRLSMLYGLADVARCGVGLRPALARLRRCEFWALDGVSFSIGRGDICGIVGRNGSGKTTLLRILGGIFPPDTGEAVIDGRIASLLSVDAGFHPHLTVRENIFLCGAIAGLKRAEIESAAERILDFSGLAGFVRSPVAALSYGMHVRLGLSVGLCRSSDLFIIDEVLSFTDMAFQEKAAAEIRRIGERAAVMIVSHNKGLIKNLCNRCIVMDKGRIAWDGTEVNEGLRFYADLHRGVEDDNEL